MPGPLNAPPLKAPPPYKASPPAASAPAGASSSHQGPAPSDPAESAQQATAAASTHRHWMCPACTLFGGTPCLVESAPFHSVNPAGTDHLHSKKHAISMKLIGRHILSGPSIKKYFSYMPDEPRLPSGLEMWELEPLDRFNIYMRECRGNEDMTIDHFVYQGAEDPRRPDVRFLSESD